MREIWMMQPRFEKRTWAARRLAWWSSRAFAPPSTSCACAPTHGEVDVVLADWWQEFSHRGQ
jgi:poly(A) polymerase